MNSIYNLLQNKSKDNLSIYFTAGFPTLNDTAKVIQELSKAKVDFIEVGLPYSCAIDPWGRACFWYNNIH